jgi:hypothetical protein
MEFKTTIRCVKASSNDQPTIATLYVEKVAVKASGMLHEPCIFTDFMLKGQSHGF